MNLTRLPQRSDFFDTKVDVVEVTDWRDVADKNRDVDERKTEINYVHDDD